MGVASLKRTARRLKERLAYRCLRWPRYRLWRTPLFENLMIQTNYTCTRSCTFCHYGQPERPQPQTMSMQLFEKILLELSALRYRGRLSLFEINEPLTDTRITRMLQMATAAVPGAFHLLLTNGDLLTERVGLQLFKDGLSFLIVNSYDAESRRRNEHMVEVLQRQKCHVRHVDLRRKTDWSSRSGNVARQETVSRPGTCERVFVQMIVKPSGLVPGCVHEFHDGNVMGDVNTQSLRQIWFGERFEALRRDLVRGRRSRHALCARCDNEEYGGYFDFKIRRGR